MRPLLLLALAAIAFAETRQALPDRYYNTFSHTNPVMARINPGDIVTTKTVDSSGMDEKGQQRATGSNPLTGPFYIENAEPGDAIAVHLRKVRLNRNWGYTSYRLAPFAVLPEYVESMYPNHYKPDAVRKGRDNIPALGSRSEIEYSEAARTGQQQNQAGFPGAPDAWLYRRGRPGGFLPDFRSVRQLRRQSRLQRDRRRCEGDFARLPQMGTALYGRRSRDHG
jgi:hypothetical protein